MRPRPWTQDSPSVPDGSGLPIFPGTQHDAGQGGASAERQPKCHSRGGLTATHPPVALSMIRRTARDLPDIEVQKRKRSFQVALPIRDTKFPKIHATLPTCDGDQRNRIPTFPQENLARGHGLQLRARGGIDGCTVRITSRKQNGIRRPALNGIFHSSTHVTRTRSKGEEMGGNAGQLRNLPSAGSRADRP